MTVRRGGLALALMLVAGAAIASPVRRPRRA